MPPLILKGSKRGNSGRITHSGAPNIISFVSSKHCGEVTGSWALQQAAVISSELVTYQHHRGNSMHVQNSTSLVHLETLGDSHLLIWLY